MRERGTRRSGCRRRCRRTILPICSVRISIDVRRRDPRRACDDLVDQVLDRKEAGDRDHGAAAPGRARRRSSRPAGRPGSRTSSASVSVERPFAAVRTSSGGCGTVQHAGGASKRAASRYRGPGRCAITRRSSRLRRSGGVKSTRQGIPGSDWRRHVRCAVCQSPMAGTHAFRRPRGRPCREEDLCKVVATPAVRFALPVAVLGSSVRGAHRRAAAAPHKQKIDAEYTAKIKEYLQDPRITTELVDHLPASDTVPTPLKFLGRIVGTPGELTYAKDIHRYFEAIDKASDRVAMWSIGKTEEGRDMVAARDRRRSDDQAARQVQGHDRAADRSAQDDRGAGAAAASRRRSRSTGSRAACTRPRTAAPRC